MRPLDVLFLIPARKGSKRFPGKNTVVFDGLALHKWAEYQAMGAMNRIGGACKIVISTDDPDIKVNYFNGFTFRLERPDHLAEDDTTSEAVALHALEHFPADMVCLLQPTSPLRTSLDIVRCVMQCPSHTCTHSGNRLSIAPNGAVYCMFSEHLRAGHKFSEPSFCDCVMMPAERSIDVDTSADLAKAAEYLERYNGESEHQS